MSVKNNDSEYKRKVELFNESMIYMQKEMGLLQFEIVIHPIEDEVDYRACCHADIVTGLATIWYSTIWLSSDISDYEICVTAFHELMEANMHKIRYYLREFYSENFIDSIIHEQIRINENVMFKTIYSKFKKEKNKK